MRREITTRRTGKVTTAQPTAGLIAADAAAIELERRYDLIRTIKRAGGIDVGDDYVPTGKDLYGLDKAFYFLVRQHRGGGTLSPAMAISTVDLRKYVEGH